MGFTKLFQSILTSSVWREDDKTRLVWITLLALKDKNGEVEASVPGLAHMAGVAIEDATLALEKLMAPDPWSRTKDYEGRRLEEIPGGWIVLNAEKYKLLDGDEDRKGKAAERQARYRERKKRNAPKSGVTERDMSRLSDAKPPYTDTDTDKDYSPNAGALGSPNSDLLPGLEASGREATPKPSGQSDELPSGPNGKTEKRLPTGFADFWKVYPRRVGKADAIKAWEKALKACVLPRGSDLAEKIEALKRTEQWQNPEFIPHPATFINGRRWEDEIPTNGASVRHVIPKEEQARRIARAERIEDERRKSQMKQS